MLLRSWAGDCSCLPKTGKIWSKGCISKKVRAVPREGKGHVLWSIPRDVGYFKSIPNPKKIQPKFAQRSRSHGNWKIKSEKRINYFWKGYEPKYPPTKQLN